MRMHRRSASNVSVKRVGRLRGAALAAGVLLLACASSAEASRHMRTKHERLPVLFVHGIESAGNNFASQEMRFESNGYPHTWLDAMDYDSEAATGSQTEVDKQIEEAVAMLKQASGKSKVDIVAHSLGTSVVYDYLTEGEKAAERRASVAAYANLDGQEKNPGVPTIAVWAGRCGDETCEKPERHMEGAENVFIPDATHVQTSSSALTFQYVYKFFTGKRPRRDIRPVHKKATIELAGKALEFPQNMGLAGYTLEIWPLNSSGQRTTATPIATIPITNGAEGGGEWGPVTAKPYTRYEFSLTGAETKTLHMYMEPFVRSDYDVRLLDSVPLAADVSKFPKSAVVVMVRFEEFWGNQPGENDELLVNGLNVCTAALCPWEKEVIAFFAYNWEGKEESTLQEEPVIGELPFLKAAQVYVPASEPPDATISLQLKSRTGGPLRTLNVPNWEGTKNIIEVWWNDFSSLKFEE